MTEWTRCPDSYHPESWQYGENGDDNWASIIASDTGSIAGHRGDGWTVEFYDGSPIEREIVDTYPEMLLAVNAFMERHIGHISARDGETDA
jgi:hypothetical protein